MNKRGCQGQFGEIFDFPFIPWYTLPIGTKIAKQSEESPMCKALTEEGYSISARTVARVLSEHGVTLKKNEAESLNHILLKKSCSVSQGDKKSKCNRTPDEIKRELDKVLKNGFHTFYGGSFLLIPYLLQLGIMEKVDALKVEKQSGIPVEKAVLALLHLGIVGKKRISRVGDVKDQGFA